MGTEPTFGDTSLGTWILELITACGREVDGRDQYDLTLMLRMCQAERARAHEAAQIWAQELTRELGDRPVSATNGVTGAKVMLLGGVATCLDVIARRSGEPVGPRGFSESVEWLVDVYPIVYDCILHVSDLISAPGMSPPKG